MSALRITEIIRHTLHVPFVDRVKPWNALLVGQWAVVEVIEVRTDDRDITGWGESVPAYTSDRVDESWMGALIGQNAVEHLWNPAVGMGMQMALADIAGKALEVPLARLLHLPQVRTTVPIAWWNTKMPPEVLAAEAQDAVLHGYRAHKFKARPWIDPIAQVEAISAVTPEDYRLDIDWNRMLLDRPTALRLLRRLDTYSKVGIFESPLARGQFAEYRTLREQLQHPIAEHFDEGPFGLSAVEGSYDGYVFSPNTQGNGLGSLLRQGILAEAFAKSGWIQLVGCGLTTAFALQVASVLPAARWPMVTAMNNYTDDLITEQITITAGQAVVPAGIGLGVTVDRDALERYRVPFGHQIEYPRTILTMTLPGGWARQYVSIEQMWRDCQVNGAVPLTGEGASLSIRQDDRSAQFEAEYSAIQQEPRWT